MNKIHEVNRKYWNNSRAEETERLSEDAGIWRRCHREPNLAFDCDMLSVIREFLTDLKGKEVCVIGSGDNHAAFAMAGLGANVTSVDQSEKQIEVASKRARELGLSITFRQSDATDMGFIEPSTFVLVCSTNGFFVWISDLKGLFSEVQRILRPQGFYVFYDIHPFQRPWEDMLNATEMKKPYAETGPFYVSKEGAYNFHWTMEDMLNALADADLLIRRLRENSAGDSRYWEGTGYLSGLRPSLLNWEVNPLAGLPVWLLLAAEKG